MTTRDQGGQLLSAEDVAKQVGVHIDTVRRWLQTGQLKGYRLSRRTGWRVYQRDLDAFIERHFNQPQTAAS